jgi:tRNA pseudouridine38-40 synthase
MNPGSDELQAYWAKVEYDGTDFFGFQVQERRRTVQGEIEQALEHITGIRTRVVGAGRTDRGVHAAGQTISFSVAWRHTLADLQRALNAVLASDVVVLELGLAARGFHPRYGARRRAYRYTVLNRPWRSPLERRISWQVARKLDVGCMNEASGCLVGTHDFATFGKPPQGQNTVRTVYRAEWTATGARFTFDIEANAFLYRMVRSIVGTLVQVGWQQVSPDEFKGMLEAMDRSMVRVLAPAEGLCLMRVDYTAREGV